MEGAVVGRTSLIDDAWADELPVARGRQPRAAVPLAGGASPAASTGPRGPPDAAASAPHDGLDAPPLPDGGFRSLIEQARAAHDREVERLQLELRGLRAELLAARRAEAPPAQGDDAPDSPGSPSHAKLAASKFKGDDAPDSPGSSARAKSAALKFKGDDAPDSPGSPAHARAAASKFKAAGPSKSSRALSTTKQQTMRAQAAQKRGCLWRFVTSAAFEVAVALVIITNGVVMGVEAQYAGYVLAEGIGYERSQGHYGREWQHASEAFDVLHVVFGVFFTGEIILKIVALRSSFVCDAWNWIDLTVVLLWVYSVLNQFAMNASLLRLARLARLVRLVRIFKFMQSHYTESLFLLSTALSDSIRTTAWTFVFFFVVHAMLALFINHSLTEFYFEAGTSMSEEQVLVYEYFGSFSRAFCTMFEITFDNWSDGVRALMDHVSEWFLVYGVLHKILIGFAAVGVIGAVFIQEVFQVADMDDNLMVRQQSRKEHLHTEKMQRLFQEADADGDGSIDLEEWLEVSRDSVVQMWLRAQDLCPKDARRVFELLDDGDGRLTAEELVSGTASLKGSSVLVQILGLTQGTHECTSEIRAELLAAPIPPLDPKTPPVSARRSGDPSWTI